MVVCHRQGKAVLTGENITSKEGVTGEQDKTVSRATRVPRWASVRDWHPRTEAWALAKSFLVALTPRNLLGTFVLTGH